ncbi:hypothetical protein D9M69_708150 [compost metagenome]
MREGERGAGGEARQCMRRRERPEGGLRRRESEGERRYGEPARRREPAVDAVELRCEEHAGDNSSGQEECRERTRLLRIETVVRD